MATYCNECGAMLQEGETVCRKCGTPVGGQTVEQVQPQLQSQLQEVSEQTSMQPSLRPSIIKHGKKHTI